MGDALSEAVTSAYQVAPIRACVRFDRAASTVARIETTECAYWLKLSTRKQQELDTLESEAEVANELAQQGLRVASAVRRRDGRYAGPLVLPESTVPALLFNESPGGEVETPTAAQAEALGMLLGQFHGATADAAVRRWRIDADTLGRAPLVAVEQWLQRIGGEIALGAGRRCASLETLVDEMIDIAWSGCGSLPVGLCHGDVQLENVRFDGARPTIFDLECCGFGPCAYDLACYWRRRFGLASVDAEAQRAEWDSLLRGYEQTRNLTPAERQAIPALVTLRAVWVMALPAAQGTTWGQDWLLDPEYLDAHVAMIQRFAHIARSQRSARDSDTR